MTGAPDAGTIWLVIGVLAVGTFAMRLSFVQLSTTLGEFPPGVGRALRYIPAAILAALIAPELFPLGGPLAGTLVNPRSVAGAVATVVAWRTGSMTATIAVGMAVRWTLEFLLG